MSVTLTPLQGLLQVVMLRRNKNSELNGRKLLELPVKTIEMVELDFTPEERKIYDAVEKRARVQVNKYFRAGTILKHYSVILVMLMRLRQLCLHPWLLRSKNKDALVNGIDFTVSDTDIFDNLDTLKGSAQDEVERAVALLGQAWVDKVTQTLKNKYESMSDEGPPATQARAADDENDYVSRLAIGLC